MRARRVLSLLFLLFVQIGGSRTPSLIDSNTVISSNTPSRSSTRTERINHQQERSQSRLESNRRKGGNVKCDISLIGNDSGEVTVEITCGDVTVGPTTFNYNQSPELAPDTSSLGFRLFASSNGNLFAVIVNPNVRLTVTHLIVQSLNSLASLFLVENASLTIKAGTIEKVHDATISAVLFAINADIEINDLNCQDTSGNQTGVLVAEESSVSINNSEFNENIGNVYALLFFIYDHSSLTIADTHLSGPLPHPDTLQNGRQFQLPSNFDNIAAKAGAAFVSGSSNLSTIATFMEHYPSIQGMVYLEKESAFVCLESRLENNIALYGGAVYSDDSFVKMRHVYTHMNSASRGGTLLLHGFSSCDLQDVYFEHNLAILGGALYIEVRERGVEQKDVTIFLKNCIFQRNTGTNIGGGIYSRRVSLNLVECDFVNNRAEHEGGAIYANASTSLNLTDVGFVGNTAASAGAVAIHAEDVNLDLEVSDATFTKNRALKAHGGAFLLVGSSSTVKIRSTHFEQNEAVLNGGAVYGWNVSAVEADDVIFTSNSAVLGSGASLYIVNTTDIRLRQSRFLNGKAGIYGGQVYVDQSSTVEIETVHVAGCSAGNDGGAFALFLAETIMLANSTVNSTSYSHKKRSNLTQITGCVAQGSGGGVSFKDPRPIAANVTLQHPRVRILHSSFSGNKANFGGGLFFMSIESISIFNSSFLNNSVTGKGGGLYLYNVSSTDLLSVNASGNSAQNRGGAIHAIDLPYIVIKDSQLSDNRAGRFGGGASLEFIPSVRIEHSVLNGNNAEEGSGGALRIIDVHELSITGFCEFAENKAYKTGGAIDTTTPKTTHLSETVFISNKAEHGSGGAFYFSLPDASERHSQRHLQTHDTSEDDAEEKDFMEFEKVTFTNNVAGSSGGALHLDHLDGGIDMDKVSFTEGTAINGNGGCAHITNIHRLTAPLGIYSQNTAKGHGGCFFLRNVPSVDLKRSQFSACISSEGKGGAVYIDQDNSTGTVLSSDGVYLGENRAASGGAYYLNKIDTVILNETKFHDNVATDGSGGGLQLRRAYRAMLRDLRMDDNEASVSCGGFCLSNVQHAFISGQYTSNKASGLNGGAALIESVQQTTIDGIFSKNYAFQSGGGIMFTNCHHIETKNGTIFDSNQAQSSSGGGLEVELVQRVSINGTHFNGNEAIIGGGIALRSIKMPRASKVKILACHFDRNRASGNGGGLAVTKRNPINAETPPPQTAHLYVNVSDTLFTGNRAKNGGGIAVMAGDVNLQDSNFSGNNADRQGGGLYFDNRFNLIILNRSLIERNTAHKGGAIVVSCPTKVNFTYALVRHNAAHRRDDGGLVICDEHFVFLANVTFVHNFRNHRWYFYIIFIVGGYAVLFFFLIGSHYVFRRFGAGKEASITVYAYSDIGERDSEAADLDSFFVNPPAASVSSDEPIIAPKPLPGEGSHSGEQEKSDSGYRDEGEIQEGPVKEEPLPQSRYPDYV